MTELDVHLDVIKSLQRPVAPVEQDPNLLALHSERDVFAASVI